MKVQTKKACGEIFSELMAQFCAESSEAYGFAIGFAAGQAEKVALRACPAYMVRIMPEHYDSFKIAVIEIADKFGLKVAEEQYVNPENGKLVTELWTSHPESILEDWSTETINSKNFHMKRAKNCGIHHSIIDFEYHNYRGYLGKTALEYKGK